MTNEYTITTRWPEVGWPPEEEEDEKRSEELREWLDDPFKRRLLYTFHLIYMLIRILVLSLLMGISAAGVGVIAPGLVAGSSTLWVLIGIGLSLEFIDSVLDQPVSNAAAVATYHIFTSVGKLYLTLKERNGATKPDVSEDNFASWINHAPELGILRNRSGRNLL